MATEGVSLGTHAILGAFGALLLCLLPQQIETAVTADGPWSPPIVDLPPGGHVFPITLQVSVWELWYCMWHGLLAGQLVAR
jgi:hypothetical protein